MKFQFCQQSRHIGQVIFEILASLLENRHTIENVHQARKEYNMGSPIMNKDEQMNFLKQRLTMFLEVLDNIDPEAADLEDVDRLIEILDELETKCEQFKSR